MTFWIDVEDLFEYAAVSRRPSGIQRLSFELYQALVAERPEGIVFCRHDRVQNSMRAVPWTTVSALFHRMTAQADATAPRAAPRNIQSVRQVSPGGLRRLAARLPPDIRLPLGEAVRGQVGVLRAGLQAAQGSVAALRRQLKSARPTAAEDAPGGDLRDLARPGDTLLILGSPWSRSDYGQLVGRLKQATGLSVAMLVYDLIPMLRPEFCDPGLVPRFVSWIERTSPMVDHFFAISRASARDMEAIAPRLGLRLPGRVIPLPIGTGFGQMPDAAAGRTPRVTALAPGYALIVSTIEARKNHILAFRAWRRLLELLPAEQVPTLVFAGHVGWMVADLMQQLENCQYLNGKIVLIEDPSDSELAALYAGCRFTLFPSHYEGWGLPVTESLAFGKPCIASSATSVPEAGGPFCLYHDPDNVLEAVTLLRRAIAHPEEITALEERIRAEFRPTPWAATAQALIRALESPRSAAA